ncbi:MAG: glycosyltransferase family 2 protein [Deltaproteobacteria bacterium]|nr:glycosyltransferase family 2 protein [Deltaproteobacteria bacterium]
MTTHSSQLPAETLRYLRKRALSGPWLLEGSERSDYDGAVVIPALAESRHLPATLQSLAQNPPEILKRFLVVVVVNHGVGVSPADKEDNNNTLLELRDGKLSFGALQPAWVDAASPGRELPGKGGVGPARKLGFDLALSHCRFNRTEAPIFISLDADTLVEPTYLAAIIEHFRNHPQGCAVLPFRHQAGKTQEIDTAIRHYELYLRSYVLGLSLAGSPYAFHTIGSTIACRAGAYVRNGGMNRRPSGEDFYFLQQMQKTTGVAHLRGTTVHPSPRPSLRVPFGTGPTVARFLREPDQAVRFYHPDSFSLLGAWLSCAESHWQASADTVIDKAGFISSHLADFLRGIKLSYNWPRLQANHPNAKSFIAAFHGWFDALRSRQLLHYLSSGPLPYCDRRQSLKPMFARSGLPFSDLLAEQLEVIRHFQAKN